MMMKYGTRDGGDEEPVMNCPTESQVMMGPLKEKDSAEKIKQIHHLRFRESTPRLRLGGYKEAYSKNPVIV